ncbi:MAG: transport protein TqsA [Frankiaceae bacterium]|nr:transport protein TqsA [Frankiaceae bacterium]
MVGVLLGCASLFITLAGIRAARDLVGTVFLALVLVVTVAPINRRLRKHRVPGWLATACVLLTVLGIVFGLFAVLVYSVARLATLIPTYSDQAQGYLDALSGRLQDLGVATHQADQTASSLDPQKVTDSLGNLLTGLTGVLGSAAFLIALLLFMGLDSAGFERRLAAVAVVRPATASALTIWAAGTRRYLAVSSLFGLIVAVIDGAVLAALGVPLPILWALLAFITNYIPNIGFVLGLVPPALLALLDGGVQQMLIVIVTYSAINFVIQSVLQPKFVGNSVGLSVTLTFLALVVWTFILGPLGALLAIPLTLLVKALLIDVDDKARWLTALTDARPPEPSRSAAT